MKSKEYLTQTKLAEILSTMFEITMEVPITGSRFKSDIQFEYNGDKYAVEFDGDSHYCDILVMERDLRKDRLLMSQGFSVVRIPYWIQLDDYTFEMLFRFKSPNTINRNYPHGFIDKKAKTPSYFCVNGVNKFIMMMSLMAEKYRPVFDEIIHSMVYHSFNNNRDNIIPSVYGYPQLKSLLEYLIDFDGSTEECQKPLYNTFIALPSIHYPNCSIENTVEC